MEFNDVPVIATAANNAFQILLSNRTLTAPVLHAISRALLVSINTTFELQVWNLRMISKQHGRTRQSSLTKNNATTIIINAIYDTYTSLQRRLR
jgi:hypothetical protein